MKHKTLIIRGANSTDDLGNLGVISHNIARVYSECDRVIFIDKRGESRVVKGSEEDASLVDLQFFDIEDSLGDFLLCLRKIKDAYNSAHSNTKDLAHAFVGQWLFNWISSDTKNPFGITVFRMLQEGMREQVADSADEFIEKDFGMSSVIILQADGTKIPRVTNPPADGVSSDDGAGEKRRSDS